VRASQSARGEGEQLVDQVFDADHEWRLVSAHFEQLRSEQKSLGRRLDGATGEQRQVLLSEAKEISRKVKAAHTSMESAKLQLDGLLSQIPNVIEDAVVAGGQDDYVVLREVGRPRSFAEEGIQARDHLELAESLRAIDMERGAKVAGSRSYFLTGQGAELELALMVMGMRVAIDWLHSDDHTDFG